MDNPIELDFNKYKKSFDHDIYVKVNSKTEIALFENTFLPKAKEVLQGSIDYLNSFIDVKSLPDRFHYLDGEKIDNLDDEPWWLEGIKVSENHVTLDFYTDLDRYGLWSVELEYRNSQRYAIREPHFWPVKLCRVGT